MKEATAKSNGKTRNEAKEAYDAKAVRANELLKSIKAGIAKQGKGSINWANVGSMSYALGLLTDLDNFINGTSK